MVDLRQDNNIRIVVAILIYLPLFAGETYLSVQNAAIGCATIFIVVQAVSAAFWLAATWIFQNKKGQGNPKVYLNDINSPEYRCFRIPVLGKHVLPSIMSFHLENLEKFQLYGSNWETLMLKLAGIFVILSAILDVLSTILIVGKTTWAYYWIGIELAVILVKVGCCLEPLRFTEIRKTHTNATEMMTQTPDSTALRLPLDIHLADPWRCQMVATSHNIFENQPPETCGNLQPLVLVLDKIIVASISQTNQAQSTLRKPIKMISSPLSAPRPSQRIAMRCSENFSPQFPR